jgi:hypothetical protein
VLLWYHLSLQSLDAQDSKRLSAVKIYNKILNQDPQLRSSPKTIEKIYREEGQLQIKAHLGRSAAPLLQ